MTAEDQTDAHFEPGVSCARCFNETTARQKASFRERHRQSELAKHRAENGSGKPPRSR